MKKISTIVIVIILCIVNVVPVFASYDRSAVVAYAYKYADDANSTYYEFSSDCTNFVSQCEAVGGVVSYMPNSFPSAPSVFSNLKVDSSSDYWYMVHRTRSVGKNYYIYTKTWSCVREFRDYFKGTRNSGSNSIAKVYSYKTSYWETAKSKLVPGDVLQYDENGHAHSIIIVSVHDRGGVKYCAHSNNRFLEDISTFKKSLAENNIQYFYVIKYNQ